VAGARVAGLDDVYLVTAEDVPEESDVSDGLAAAPREPTGGGPVEQQLAVLAVRVEMAAVYLRLARG
jgi:hypothetical protein